jgi:hypothetical protein
MAEEPIKLFATRSERYPEPGARDAVQGATRAALAAIPILGGSITEVLSMILLPAVARRRDEWFKEIADALDQLEARVDGFKVENLVDDEGFATAVIHATRIAIGTHQQQKREMLRNALLNIAVGRGPREDLQQVFLDAIDTFTPSHMKVLKFFWTGVADLNRAGVWDALHPLPISNYAAVIGSLHSDLKGQEGLMQYLMTDIRNRGFSTILSPSDTFPQGPGITNLGIEFLRFVLEPPK